MVSVFVVSEESLLWLVDLVNLPYAIISSPSFWQCMVIFTMAVVPTYNGVDTITRFYPRDEFIGGGYMVDDVKWRHLMNNPDEYVYLCWSESGHSCTKLISIEDVTETGNYWKYRDVALEVEIARQCKNLFLAHGVKKTMNSCPRCGHQQYLYHDKSHMLISYCRECRRPFIIGCNADALGIETDVEKPEKRKVKNNRWNRIEIDGM